MSDQFSQPTFFTGVDETLAVVDTYTGNVKGVVNSATSAFKNATDTVISTIKGSKLVQDLTAFRDVLTEIKSLDAKTVMARLTAMSPELQRLTATVDAVKTLGKEAQKEFEEAKKVYGEVVAEFNGIKSKFDSFDFEKAVGLNKAVEEITGEQTSIKLKDSTTAASVTAALIIEASAIRLPGIFSKLIGKITDPTQIAAIIKKISLTMVEKSDYKLLHEIAVNPESAYLLLQTHPEVISQFAARFTLQESTPINGYADIGTTILESFSFIDPRWNVTVRNGVDVTCTIVLRQSSDDFKKVARLSSTNFLYSIFGVGN